MKTQIALLMIYANGYLCGLWEILKNIIVRVTPPSILLHAFNFEKDINSLYNSDTIKYYLIRNINLVLIATWILYAHSSRE